MKKAFIIARNAFTETIRQPVFMILLAGGAFMISLSPAYAMFTMMDDIKLVKDMGLATMLLTGLLQAVFSAVRIVSHEIENKTILTVLTKPVSKAHLVVGKFLGLCLAVALSMYLLNTFLVMAVRVGVPEAVLSPVNRPLAGAQLFALLAALVTAAFANYFQDKPFGASLFVNAFITFTLVFIVFGFLDIDMNFQGFLRDFDMQVLKAGYLVFMSVVVFCAVAVAFATRFGPVFTIGFCLSLFIVGLLSDHIFGRFAAESVPALAAYSVVPNMQVFWLADAVSEGMDIPNMYLLAVSVYGIMYAGAALIFGTLIFEQKESS